MKLSNKTDRAQHENRRVAKKAVAANATQLYARAYRKRNPVKRDQWSDHQVLATLLRSSEAAEAVLTHCGSFKNLCNLHTAQELAGAPGMGETAIIRLEAILETLRRAA